VVNDRLTSAIDSLRKAWTPGSVESDDGGAIGGLGERDRVHSLLDAALARCGIAARTPAATP